MKLPRLPRRRRRDPGGLAEAELAAAAAKGEAARSEARQERIRAEVIGPLRIARAHNQFAEMLRQSLIEEDG